jgi:DNA-binding beta-propeller fold protein YncE
MQRQNPIGVAVDGAGNVYVSDWGGNHIVLFSAAGEVVGTIGVGQLRQGGARNALGGGAGVGVGPAAGIPGNLMGPRQQGAGAPQVNPFTGDHQPGMIEMMQQMHSRLLHQARGGGGQSPMGQGVEQSFPPMHPQAQIAMQMQRQNPIGVAVDGAGSVFVSDYGGNRVVVFSAAGEVVRTIGGPGNGEGQLNQPCGVAVDGDGNRVRT